ncbi:MAG: hypothetical protein V2A71_07565 [Candidatus Eisenbacteria bacterium]
MPEKFSIRQSMLLTIKDGLAVAKEAAIALLILLFFLSPATIGSSLKKAGFTKVSLWGVEADLAKQSYEATVQLANEIATIEATSDTLSPSTQNRIEIAKQRIDGILADQVKLLEKAAPDLMPREGWIFLGTVDESRTAWKEGSPVAVKEDAWPLERGTTLTVAKDGYLRGTPLAGPRTSGPIQASVRAGDRVRVVELDFSRERQSTADARLSRTRTGGWLVTAKVTKAD